jgi:hypothetical protein
MVLLPELSKNHEIILRLGHNLVKNSLILTFKHFLESSYKMLHLLFQIKSAQLSTRLTIGESTAVFSATEAYLDSSILPPLTPFSSLCLNYI